MLKRCVVMAAVVAVAISGCASTSVLPAPRTAVTVTVPAVAAPTTLERKPIVLPPRTTSQRPTRTTTPTPRTTTEAAPKPPSLTWVPTLDMGVDTIMRNSVADALAWWNAGLPTKVTVRDAKPGDITCGGVLNSGHASHCSDRTIRWNTANMLELARTAPWVEARPWLVAIIAGHEVGHAVAGTYINHDTIVKEQQEGLADCLSAAYIGLRYRPVLNPTTEGRAFAVLDHVRTHGYTVHRSYSAGVAVPAGATPTQAFKWCRSAMLG